jgi:hypothetical protein
MAKHHPPAVLLQQHFPLRQKRRNFHRQYHHGAGMSHAFGRRYRKSRYLKKPLHGADYNHRITVRIGKGGIRRCVTGYAAGMALQENGS